MLEINDVVLYCIVLYCIVLYCIVLYCIVLYCIVICIDEKVLRHGQFFTVRLAINQYQSY